MALRRIYQDKRGSYFKGEGFIFRLPKNQRHGSHVEVFSVTCGGGWCALAGYYWHGRRYFVSWDH
jgi:hypothetical protein